MKIEEVYALPTVTESEREMAKDAAAGIAYVKGRGLADEGDMLAALGLTR